MDTDQIDGLLATDAYTRTVVQDVVSKNGLPTITKLPVAFVCNIHNSDKPGQHWISIYMSDEGRGEYFDSYGRPPNQTFLRNNCREWTFNDRRLQSPLSNVCGQYCVVYLLYRCRGVPMATFVKSFNTDLVSNDCRVYDLVKTL